MLGWMGLLGECITLCLRLDNTLIIPFTAASSIGLNVALATAASHSDDVFSAQTGRWITSTYAITLATNLSATSKPLTRLNLLQHRS